MIIMDILKSTLYIKACVVLFIYIQFRVHRRLPATNPSWNVKFCETQWRHSVKTRLYKTPTPYFILWNAVTSLGENKVI